MSLRSPKEGSNCARRTYSKHTCQEKQAMSRAVKTMHTSKEEVLSNQQDNVTAPDVLLTILIGEYIRHYQLLMHFLTYLIF